MESLAGILQPSFDASSPVGVSNRLSGQDSSSIGQQSNGVHSTDGQVHPTVPTSSIGSDRIGAESTHTKSPITRSPPEQTLTADSHHPTRLPIAETNQHSEPRGGSASNGLVVHGTSLKLGQVETIGSGHSSHEISLLEQHGSTFIVYDQTSTSLVHAALHIHRTGASGNVDQLKISTDSNGQYVVDGQTFAPSIPITLTRKDGPVTYRMLTTGTRTYIAVGTSTTVPLGAPHSEGLSTGDVAALEFTRASNGDFVLHGTTLVSGLPITIGIGVSRTTLRITTIHHTPAVVVDGTLTERLVHDEKSSTSASSTALPRITSAPPPRGSTHRTSSETSKSSGSTVAKPIPKRSQVVLISMISAVILLISI